MNHNFFKKSRHNIVFLTKYMMIMKVFNDVIVLFYEKQKSLKHEYSKIQTNFHKKTVKLVENHSTKVISKC